MKKKEYMTPTMDVVEIKNMTLLAGSGVTSDEIDFGGIDEGGTLDPAAPPGLLPNMGLPSFVFE
jgi:hypothetical protein